MALIVHLGYGRGDSVDNVSKKSERYYPYRKPTQVIGKRILRRSRDSWLRN